MDLPIFEIADDVVAALGRSNRLILKAPTGSGKSTQIPQFLVDRGICNTGRVVVLQPRRLAARMLAARVARERGVELGEEVGYQIRFENRTSRKTRIVYLTEGIILRQLLADPELKDVSAILLDEFHERHLYSDITLGRALDLQERSRPDLKVIVMSATLEHLRLEEYLAPCEVVESEGRMFPVEIDYLSQNPQHAVWDLAAEAVAREFPKTNGHVLVFMPGAYEIQRTVNSIRAQIGGDVPVLPLHGEMPPAQQDEAVEPGALRKVIVSTNVAETSLTIDGVTQIIDSGLARVARFDAHRGINTLLVEKISRASADQRSGRAGRTVAGRCLRLWTIYDHERRVAHELPEVRRMDLAEVVLSLKASGVVDVTRFRWLEPPAPKALEHAELLLRDLGALSSETGEMTELGRRMLAFPMHPRYARMFLAAEQLGAVRAAAMIAALTQGRNLLMRADSRVEAERRELFGTGRSDFHMLIRAFVWAERQDFRVAGCKRLAVHAEAARQVRRLFDQFLDIARLEGLTVHDEPASDEVMAKIVLAGFADQVARRRNRATLLCDVVHGRRAMLAKNSAAANSRLVVAAEINEIGQTGGEVSTVLGLVSEIEEQWLSDLFPQHIVTQREMCFDSIQNRVVERQRRCFRDLVLEEIDREPEPGPEVASCLAREIADGHLPLSGWDEEVDAWVERIKFLAKVMPELQLPVINDEARRQIMERVCFGSTTYRQVKDKSVLPVLRSWLGEERASAVMHHAPDRLELPNGRKGKILYDTDPPKLRAVIQDLFDVKTIPRVAAGRVGLAVEILAPNQRPVQITQDLASFWQTAYPKLKSELQRKYPKHVWK